MPSTKHYLDLLHDEQCKLLFKLSDKKTIAIKIAAYMLLMVLTTCTAMSIIKEMRIMSKEPLIMQEGFSMRKCYISPQTIGITTSRLNVNVALGEVNTRVSQCILMYFNQLDQWHKYRQALNICVMLLAIVIEIVHVALNRKYMHYNLNAKSKYNIDTNVCEISIDPIAPQNIIIRLGTGQIISKTAACLPTI